MHHLNSDSGVVEYRVTLAVLCISTCTHYYLQGNQPTVYMQLVIQADPDHLSGTWEPKLQSLIHLPHR